MDFSGFHDATFIGLDVFWLSARVVLRFRLHLSHLVCIEIDGFHDVYVPQMNEWGVSESVNKLRWNPDVLIFEVEMQSGDVIRIAGDRCAIVDGHISV